MDNKMPHVFLALFVLAALISAPACSAPSEKNGPDVVENAGHNEDLTAVLKDVPEDTLTRFILTVSTDKEGRVERKQIDAILDSLRKSGAKAEWLEGSPVIFVTCEKVAIYEALETGYIASVQVDRLRKPMD